MTEREPDPELEQAAFEGRLVRPARRRIDPLRIGVAIAVVGLAAAILKPWDGPAQTTEAQPGPAALASPAAEPATQPSQAPPTIADVAPRPFDRLGPGGRRHPTARCLGRAGHRPGDRCARDRPAGWPR